MIKRYKNKNAGQNLRVDELAACDAMPGMRLCKVIEKTPRFDVGTTLLLEKSFLFPDNEIEL